MLTFFSIIIFICSLDICSRGSSDFKKCTHCQRGSSEDTSHCSFGIQSWKVYRTDSSKGALNWSPVCLTGNLLLDTLLPLYSYTEALASWGDRLTLVNQGISINTPETVPTDTKVLIIEVELLVQINQAANRPENAVYSGNSIDLTLCSLNGLLIRLTDWRYNMLRGIYCEPFYLQRLIIGLLAH